MMSFAFSALAIARLNALRCLSSSLRGSSSGLACSAMGGVETRANTLVVDGADRRSFSGGVELLARLANLGANDIHEKTLLTCDGLCSNTLGDHFRLADRVDNERRDFLFVIINPQDNSRQMRCQCDVRGVVLNLLNC